MQHTSWRLDSGGGARFARLSRGVSARLLAGLRRRGTLVGTALIVLSTAVEARITRIEIDTVAALPANDNTARMYEQITGRAFGEIDPASRLNAIINDVGLAPRNRRGAVEYSMTFRLLKPSGDASGVLLYDVVNRGRPMSAFMLGGLPRMRGYTVVESGWQGDLVESTRRLTLRAPHASYGDKDIVGRVRTEYVVRTATPSLHLAGGAFTGTSHVSYEPVDLAQVDATLTRREREADAREMIHRDDWAFADCERLPFPGVESLARICARDGFEPGYVYELHYTARRPSVLGIGFAATRDFVTFLRHARTDDEGTPNPLAGTIAVALMHGTSQSGRFVRTYLHLGFNEGEDGRVVFEGMNPHLAAGRIPLNVRFGQPGRAYGQHADHLFPGYEPPFSWGHSFDPLARKAGSLLGRCRMTATCPKVVSTVSSTEYWQGRASLNTTDAVGHRDLALPPNVRMYLFSGTQHVPAASPKTGICRLPGNQNSYIPYLKALFLVLERWVRDGTAPPDSRVPTLAGGLLTTSRRGAIGWPDIPNVKYTGQLNELNLLDLGPEFNAADETGIIREPPVVLQGRSYGVRVPALDGDGNEIAGIRSTAIQAPLGTHLGWNFRRAGFAEGELCGLRGGFIPFARTRAVRLRAGDPRLSLEERYGSQAGYVESVRRAARTLVSQRLLLPEDAQAIVAGSIANGVLE